MRILFAEDDDSIARAVVRALQHHLPTAVVTHFSSWSEAYHELRTNSADYDVFLLDLWFGLYHTVMDVEKLPLVVRQKIIFSTADDRFQPRFGYLLSKPYETHQLVELLKHVHPE